MRTRQTYPGTAPGTPLVFSCFLYHPLSSLVSSVVRIILSQISFLRTVVWKWISQPFQDWLSFCHLYRLQICAVALSVSGKTSSDTLIDGPLDVSFFLSSYGNRVLITLMTQLLFFCLLINIMPSRLTLPKSAFPLLSSSSSFPF